MEAPDALLGRLMLGREEYCQRLLTSLILDGPYPRWNTRNTPSEAGRQFLQRLEELSFGEALCKPPLEFVDELDLGRRPQDLQGSAPDWAVFTTKRLWMVELKTERGSHRDSQVPTYVATGRHHYPDLHVDLTYLTGPMPPYAPELPDGTRYAHVTWEQVIPLAREVWGDGSVEQRAVVDRLEEVIAGLSTKWTGWRATRLGVTSAPTPASSRPPAVEASAQDGAATDGDLTDPVEQGLQLARMTSQDHRQRAIDHPAGSLEELRAIGRALREALAAERDPDLPHVVPWLWNVDTSTGTALTAAGAEVGYELRLSWYESPQA